MRGFLRISAGVAPVVICVCTLMAPSHASAQATNFRQEFQDIKNGIPGLGEDRAPIDFTERAPLVVPPTNDLPPPQEASNQLGVADPDMVERRKALSDPRRPVPLTDPGATASGASRRAYLIEPPSGMLDPAAVAGEAKAGGFKDNPKRKKKKSGLASLFEGGHKHKKAADAAPAPTATAAQ